MTTNTCPDCFGPIEVWTDRSDAVTVNFACDTPSCSAGKAPWDTPRPARRGPDLSLNLQMEFDHVIQVHEDGTVTEPDLGLYAPNVYDGELEGGGDPWYLLDGYSGQDRYSGPIMHDSEYIGGGMARDILSEPGYYVCVVAYYLPEDGDELEADGWAVAYLPPMEVTE